jgi:hypothetical protein
MVNKEIGTVIFIIFVIAHIVSIIYGFVKMLPSKKIPLGAKIIFGIMFLGIPFVGPMAFVILEKNWDKLVQGDETTTPKTTK